MPQFILPPDDSVGPPALRTRVEPAPDAARGRRRVVVVDSDRRAASACAAGLCARGWHASAAGSLEDVRRCVARGRLDALVVAGGCAAAGPAEVRAALPARHAAVPLVGVVAPGGTGGWDATVAPPAADEALATALATALAALAATPGIRGDAEAPAILGDSPAIRRVLDLVARVADTGVTVLITGESGTGKSLLARALHRAGARRAGRFVEVACGALSETLLESELFGHVAGAFTGATVDREGRFAQADGGTIFLDEIATATPGLQVKLLRVLQEMEFEPVGGGATRRVDARVVLATHEDLGALVAAGRFRADLFWRVNVVTIEMPSLRDRPGDIPLLAGHFLARAAARAGRSVEGFSPAALEALRAHDWPGNVRELEHAVERAVFLGSGGVVEADDLPPAVRGMAAPRGAAAGSLRSALSAPERQLIVEALERHGGRRDAAARALGINRTTLYKKAKRLGLDLSAVPGGRG